MCAKVWWHGLGSKVRYVCKGVGNNVFRGVICALSRDMCSKVRCVQRCGGMDWAQKCDMCARAWVIMCSGA
jgi:hypothetical protein